MCPEPGCDFASKERQDIARHMKKDHISEKKTKACLKLFFCPTCSQNLELKSGDDFQQHLQLCGQRQTSPQLSTEDDGLTNDLTPSEAVPENDNGIRNHRSEEEDINTPSTESIPNDDNITSTSDTTENFEEIKCHLCEFSLLDTGPLQPIYTTSLTTNGRRWMSQHYSDIHKIRHMRLCEKRGCSFRSTNFKQRRQHRIEHEGHIQCDICGNKILAVRFEQHQREIHGDKTYDCEYCARPYGKLQQLK